MTKITNIQRFATHDGPGIRTCVFLKGCSLNCPWCANPETRSSNPELLYNSNKCVICKHCESICESKAIKFIDNKFSWNKSLCINCFKCESECLNEAINFYGKEKDNKEIIDIVLKDINYYNNSNGGVTFSGGEPFVQFDNLLALLKLSKDYNLDTAVETTGNYHQDLIVEAYVYIDHFLYDFKHYDKQTLEEVTKGNYDLINNNLKYLLSLNPNKVNVRMPIIYGFNDNKKLIYDTLDYLKSIGCVNVNLLPYHSLGKVKFEEMNIEYNYPTQMMQDDELIEFHEYALKLGMNSKIGA